MSVTDPMTKRLTEDLEPVLALRDPRERISAYHDMPYALFRYSPEEEFELRKQVTLLETRLSQKGKRVWRISLAECLDEAMRQQRPLEDWFSAEREQGVDTIVETVHSVLSEYTPLVDLVAARMPDEPDPVRDIVFIVRTGALFPVYRTFSLLEQLKGRVHVPTVLFYEPAEMSRRLKLHFLVRLIPLAERNYNLVELGPRGTGKSYVVQEVSPYSALLTGPTTVANLFGHMGGRQKGMVQIWDFVGFDEVADLQKMPKEVITTMKTYCESGTFQRGQEAASGDASIAMFGNTNQPVDVMVQTGHLFAPMPDVIRDDMAFIDRLHFYLPGWEIPKMRNDLFTDHYGFVVDYLAEALREMRKHNFTEVIDRHFSLGSHLNARDRKAVRKTVSGLMKILFPHGEVTQEELGEIVEVALEGRRRVKEQLKKMGSFEYYHTSFSYTFQETGEERFVGVPEQGGRDLISADPLPPGAVYCAGVTGDGTVGLFRLEVSLTDGTGKLRTAGGLSGAMKESVQRAHSYLSARKNELGLARELDGSDLHVEVIDLLGNRVEAEVGVAYFVAANSALRRAPVAPGLLILGDMSVQGQLKPLRSLAEPLRVAMDNGAKRALIPIENKRTFLEVSADIVEHVDPIFFGEPKVAAMKALGL